MKITNQKVMYVITDNASIDDIMWGLLELGIDAEYSTHRPGIYPLNEQSVELLKKELSGFDLAITHNFSVNVAEACHTLSIPYIAWLFDSPLVASYTQYALYPECFIFAFDKVQKNRLKEIGVPNVFYQPLAANIQYSSRISITDTDIAKYGCDFSFVGQLYRNTAFDKLYAGLTDREKEPLNDILISKSCHWGSNVSIYNSFDKEYAKHLLSYINDSEFDIFNMQPQYALETIILAPAIAQIERKQLLKTASEICNTKLYTGKNDVECARELLGPNIVNSDIHNEELYKVYYSSKLNLNTTLRSIETGAPQRIFDIMSVGGVVLSNYQEELTELFVPDKEIVLFASIDEFIDKIAFLLTHEDSRLSIGINGYNRVSKEYNYSVSLNRMINRI